MNFILHKSAFSLGLLLLNCGCSATTKPTPDSDHSGEAEARLDRPEVLRIARAYVVNEEGIDLSRYPSQQVDYEFGGREDSWTVSFRRQDPEIRGGGFSVAIDDRTGDAHIAHRAQ